MSAMAISAVSAIPVLGDMPMPPDFRYLDTFLRGRPQHEALSDFRRKHPKMSCSRRAKLFAPFDALAGFDERIANKEVIYETRRDLSETERELLDKKLSFLCSAMHRLRHLCKPVPQITVTYFLPCTDIENDSFGSGGSYTRYTGTACKVDTTVTKTITVDDRVIFLDDVTDITGDLFEKRYEGYNIDKVVAPETPYMHYGAGKPGMGVY